MSASFAGCFDIFSSPIAARLNQTCFCVESGEQVIPTLQEGKLDRPPQRFQDVALFIVIPRRSKSTKMGQPAWARVKKAKSSPGGISEVKQELIPENGTAAVAVELPEVMAWPYSLVTKMTHAVK